MSWKERGLGWDFWAKSLETTCWGPVEMAVAMETELMTMMNKASAERVGDGLDCLDDFYESLFSSLPPFFLLCLSNGCYCILVSFPTPVEHIGVLS